MKTSARKRTPTSRLSSEPCDEASIAHRPVACVEHLAEASAGGRSPRRSCACRAALAADPVLDRAEQTGPAAGRGEDREEEEGRGRLPVRAGDAADLELARRLSEEGVGREGHGLARVADDELRDGEVERRSTMSATAPLSTASGAKSWPSARKPRDADEEGPGLDAPRVVGEVGDGRRRPG